MSLARGERQVSSGLFFFYIYINLLLGFGTSASGKAQLGTCSMHKFVVIPCVRQHVCSSRVCASFFRVLLLRVQVSSAFHITEPLVN
jgi:hypothetical protein